MIRNRRSRLIVAGLLMLLSPSVELGLIAFGLGSALELAGLAIEHRDRPQGAARRDAPPTHG